MRVRVKLRRSRVIGKATLIISTVAARYTRFPVVGLRVGAGIRARRGTIVQQGEV